MLGRLVNQHMVCNPSLAPETIWGDTLPLFLSADCRLINLECVISTRGQPWNPLSKPFHFRAHPRALEILKAAQVDCATLANNHVLDYGPEALLDCLNLLDQVHILHAGAGAHVDEAMAPAFIESPHGRIAVVALTDNEPGWEATQSQPGVHYVGWDSRGLRSPYRERMADLLHRARQSASLVIISAHIGPNWGEPSPAMRRLAYELLDLGGDVYWGHSNHTPQGVEIYKDKVIMYSTGDFVDDYAIDPEERNDLSFLFMVEWDTGRIARIRLYPVSIENFGVQLAKGSGMSFLEKSIRRKCATFGTKVEFQENVGTITLT